MSPPASTTGGPSWRRIWSSVGGRRRAHEDPSAALRRDATAAAAGLPALTVEAKRLAHAVAAGVHGRRRAGPSETFWQHRPYAFGDPASAVDWRQSARSSGPLYVRQNEWESASIVWLWRDASASLDYASARELPTKRRRADVLAGALAILLAAGGERVGLLGAPRIHHGSAAGDALIEALAAKPSADAVAAAPGAHALRPGARVVLFSDFYGDAAEAAAAPIAEAARRCAAAGAKGALVHVVDPAEETFPFDGAVEFQDPESTGRLTFGDARSLGDDYRARFAALRRNLGDLAGEVGWTFHAHRTDAAPAHTLLALYVALSDAAPRA
ncbi:MAG: DUF58 domain-containing protein [Parvularculaceae bacterium]